MKGCILPIPFHQFHRYRVEIQVALSSAAQANITDVDGNRNGQVEFPAYTFGDQPAYDQLNRIDNIPAIQPVFQDSAISRNHATIPGCALANKALPRRKCHEPKRHKDWEKINLPAQCVVGLAS